MKNKSCFLGVSAWAHRGLLAAALVSGVVSLTACAPLVVGAALGTTVMVASDRRTSGTQLEDQNIELKAAARIRERYLDSVRVTVTSYNRVVLISGEVPAESVRAGVVDIVSKVENVKGWHNELAVATSPSLTQRSGDSLVTARVKSAFVDAQDLSANAIKVVTDRGIVYLMGRLTPREINRATEIARSINGVRQVVRLFETISEDDLRRLQAENAPAQVRDGGDAKR
ncbi:MAG: hypothetical protein RI959_812 [Pseudomonadota bacterium]